MIISRRIELWINDESKEKRNEIWTYLRNLNNDVFRAANLIVSRQFLIKAETQKIINDNPELNDRKVEIELEIKKILKNIRKATDLDQKNILTEEKQKLQQERTDIKKFASQKLKESFDTSIQNETYRMIVKEFPEMPSYIAAALNGQVYQNFKNDWFEVEIGKKSIRNYRKGIPIPFMKSSMRFIDENGNIYMNWVNNISFKLNFGRDKSNNKEIMKRIMDNSYKYSDSSIQIKDNKIFLLLAVDLPDDKKELNKDISIGVDLGIVFPAYCALSEGFQRLSIGHKDDFLRIRLQMQRRRRQLQKALKLSSGGKGREKKLKALNNLTEKEINYVKTYNHHVSHQIVKFAVDNNAGLIKLEYLEGFGTEEKNKFILRNWSYFQLQKMIEYKSIHFGIEVKYVDPYHTSQTCAICGHYEEGQREKQEEFICKNPECKLVGEKINADYNAALNISRSRKYVSSKEECEYYKKNKDSDNNSSLKI